MNSDLTRRLEERRKHAAGTCESKTCRFGQVNTADSDLLRDLVKEIERLESEVEKCRGPHTDVSNTANDYTEITAKEPRNG